MRFCPRVSVHPNGHWHFAGWCKWSSCLIAENAAFCLQVELEVIPNPGKNAACPVLVQMQHECMIFLWWPRHSRLNKQIDKWEYYRLPSETHWNWIASDDDIFLLYFHQSILVGSAANTQNAFWHFVCQLFSPLSQRYAPRLWVDCQINLASTHLCNNRGFFRAQQNLTIWLWQMKHLANPMQSCNAISLFLLTPQENWRTWHEESGTT